MNLMTNNKPDSSESISLVQILHLLDDGVNSLNSGELKKIIDKLEAAKHRQEKIEYDEKKRKEQEKREWEARRIQKQKAAHVKEVTSMDLPLDWENGLQNDVRTQGIHADSIPDGLVYSLSELGRVDIEYISSITGADYKTVIETLKGSIYQNP